MTDEEQLQFEALNAERDEALSQLAVAKVEIATLTTQRDAYKKGMEAQTRQRVEATESLRKLKAGEKPPVVR